MLAGAFVRSRGAARARVLETKAGAVEPTHLFDPPVLELGSLYGWLLRLVK